MLRAERARPATDVDFDGFYREQYARLVRALLLLTGEPSRRRISHKRLCPASTSAGNGSGGWTRPKATCIERR